MIRVPLEQLFDENKRPMPGAGEIVIPGATMSLMAERDLLACYLDIANMWARLVRGRVIPAWKTPQIGDAAGGVAADADGSQLQWLIDQVDREVQALVDRPVDPATLARARTKMRASLYDIMESFSGFGTLDLLASFALFDDAPDRANQLEAGFARVTPALIQRTAREYLRAGNRTVYTIVPGARQAAAGDPQ